MKRGNSGLSLVVGIDKPLGITSHDVVNRCRSVFNEKRCGHTGTLDPAATGLLIVGVGPATRLANYLIEHDKHYRFRITFGISSDTDDAAGNIIERKPVPNQTGDWSFAENYLKGWVGSHLQIPPAYSAIKIGGQRSYNVARSGGQPNLSARTIEIFEARLIDIIEQDYQELPAWDIEVHVSKGTYIRSIARDIGENIGCGALVSSLRRTRVSSVAVEECTNLEELALGTEKGVLDPIRLLGYRSVMITDKIKEDVSCGRVIENASSLLLSSDCASVPEIDFQSGTSLAGFFDRELIALADENRLYALYRFEEESNILRSQCIFSVGVKRGY